MLLLTTEQIDRVHEVTDSLGLKRLAIIVPLPAAEVGSERIMPDGNLLICAPYGGRFDPWFAELRTRLMSLDLSRTPRADQLEPPMLRVPEQLPASGMRLYWDWRVPWAWADAYDRPAAPPPPKREVAPLAAIQDEPETDAMRELALAQNLGDEA